MQVIEIASRKIDTYVLYARSFLRVYFCVCAFFDYFSSKFLREFIWIPLFFS